jgi:hypothetical protein
MKDFYFNRGKPLLRVRKPCQIEHAASVPSRPW